MDSTPDPHPSLRRILEGAGRPDLVELLGLQLSAPDLTSLLMAAMAARAERLAAPEVLRRYRTDRFSAPAEVPFRDLRRAEDGVIGATPASWTWVTLSPVAPLGTHSSVAGVHQNRVVTTTRSGDVAADPTNALALEAGRRRSAGEDVVRLASIQRVLRAQRFDAEAAYAHFTVFGLVTAGRSLEGHRFEREAVIEHLQIHLDGLQRLGADGIEVLLTDLTGGDGLGVIEDATTRWPAIEDVRIREDSERTEGRNYYEGVCFKVRATFGSRTFEIADGGVTDWTQRMLSDRHESLCISGAGLDRIALMLASRSDDAPA